SSRLRHIRFSRDWSSDVCSTVLGERLPGETRTALELLVTHRIVHSPQGVAGAYRLAGHIAGQLNVGDPAVSSQVSEFISGTSERSEESRVGKARIGRW